MLAATYYLPQLLTSLLLAFLALKALQPIAYDVGLVDRPGSRKNHIGNIPLIGGISIFIGVLVSSSIWLPDTQELRMYLIASGMMVFIGILDDKYDLSVRVRIVGQILIASILIFGVGTYISNLGDLFRLGSIDIGLLGVFFTYFAILVLINAFNMIDGIDGLLGMLSLNTLLSITLLLLLSGETSDINFPLIISFAIVPYLAFNLGVSRKDRNKIYMGDAGSMFIGLSVIWLLAKGTQGENASFSPVTALWITALPLMDMLAIVIRRVKKGNSPFKPDRDHIHHILLRSGYTAKQTLFILSVVAVVMSSIGIIGHIYQIHDSLMVSSFILIFILYSRALKYVSFSVNKD
ncbi:UDP-N-acetylglucosamine--undecaprenyl-phosphate N-acetylglucosaminephosphotransferase [Thalassotalea agarivorans]|uniref:Undecaprenyl-phosphate alpha-N-acetylglucosaminyl 1-phosphate transferase n=1 Tax=Thalassotalea agarivorans TaxID=349064 RepID=A0A1H9YJD4_THASX|nr:UDP-N-acetylglucosamine--undecaprenyl-phosphate N-acetylglucosaminephosphotransferase [Thalassotalea agarivorans]SES68692.1 UDP-GlcNAc:undecaprenyl-phosphate GlcNAc-1-phosphate transferase [Thalassotalea agarivorans]